MKQHSIFKDHVNPSDIVYTPDWAVDQVIELLRPNGKILDPCRGNGEFYNRITSNNKHYCEIREGIDFFEWGECVDWIIGNPPYSIFEEFLMHSFNISNNVSFLVPTNKIFQRQIIMKRINDYGGIKSMIVWGSGQLLDFPFGFSVGNFHFEKNYTGDTKIILGR